MRLAVESSVVRQIRLSDGVSRVELARQLQIAPSTIGIHVNRLVRSGFLREGRRAEMAAGRPPTILELNPDAGQFIGVDVDAHRVRAISIDFAQRRLSDHTQRISASTSAADVVGQMGVVIDAVRQRSRRLLGIGLAVPGTVDIERGLALHYKFIRGWCNIPVVDKIRQQFQTRVTLENNIRSMALAERWFGQGRDVSDYWCIGIRSGIGSGLFINGELYRGPDHLAGEIGSWPCPVHPCPEQPCPEQPCPGHPAGEPRTLEEIASIPAILANLSRLAKAGRSTCVPVGKRNGVRLESLLRAVKQADSLALSVLATAAEELARVITQVQLLINPQRIIVAGPLAHLQDAFIEPLRNKVRSLMPKHHDAKTVILGSRLDAFIAALGASACAAYAFQPESFVNSSPLSK